MAAPDVVRVEELNREECLRLLRVVPVGRVAVHRAALPVIYPVNFRLTPDGIVFRTRRNSTLATATDGTVVAFEVDEVDVVFHAGWSVMVVGVAEAITDARELDEARSLPLRSWAADGDAEHFVRIPLELVTGRRIHPAGVPARR